MNPNIIKEIAEIYIRRYCPDLLKDADEVWMVLLEEDIDIQDAPHIFGKSLSLGSDRDRLIREMLSRMAVLYFCYEEVKAKEDISKKELLDRVKRISALLEIKGDFEKKAQGIIEFVFSSASASGPKKKDTKGYRVWYQHSEPGGESIDVRSKEVLMAKKQDFNLFVLREETRTQFFINGDRAEAPRGGLLREILFYVLKHKGAGGTSWNLAKNIRDVKEADRRKDLKRMAEAVKKEPMRMMEKADFLSTKMKGYVTEQSTLLRRRVIDLNKSFLSKANTSLKANKDTNEFELTPQIKYCLIESELDF